MANVRCMVIHTDGVCPGPYGICDCGVDNPPNTAPKDSYNEDMERLSELHASTPEIPKEQTWQERLRDVLKKWLSSHVASEEDDGTWYGWDTNVGNLLDDESMKVLNGFFEQELQMAEKRGQQEGRDMAVNFLVNHISELASGLETEKANNWMPIFDRARK